MPTSYNLTYQMKVASLWNLANLIHKKCQLTGIRTRNSLLGLFCKSSSSSSRIRSSISADAFRAGLRRLQVMRYFCLLNGSIILDPVPFMIYNGSMLVFQLVTSLYKKTQVGSTEIPWPETPSTHQPRQFLGPSSSSIGHSNPGGHETAPCSGVGYLRVGPWGWVR